MEQKLSGGNRLRIRFATEADAGKVLDFIRDLAEYERLPDEVIADEDSIRENVFHKHGAQVIFAEIDGTPVGFALFFHNFSTFLGKPGSYLEDLFVTPEHRK